MTGLKDARWKKVRALVLSTSDVCWLCGHRGADTVDHVVARSKGGARYDPANLRPAHASCNSRRGNREPAPVLRTSRRWVT